ncbi:hypothetical protein P9294_gp104 [Bacillus phage FADO]|uniref:Uncharacterized protein n=1 Tax=Bacillus phage FADO TaxID=2917160 RepID=A0AAE9K5X7_9CAUD|nr:hypothetical protein P9294_gp104 [Bacillus phage FADO]UNY48819.1 hypothetical protein fado_104 [Bacillus phage FADO]
MEEILKCGFCNKNITSKMDAEYSAYLTEYFCNPDCAKSEYFSYMGSRPVDIESEDNIEVKNGYLVKIEED